MKALYCRSPAEADLQFMDSPIRHSTDLLSVDTHMKLSIDAYIWKKTLIVWHVDNIKFKNAYFCPCLRGQLTQGYQGEHQTLAEPWLNDHLIYVNLGWSCILWLSWNPLVPILSKFDRVAMIGWKVKRRLELSSNDCMTVISWNSLVYILSKGHSV